MEINFEKITVQFFKKFFNFNNEIFIYTLTYNMFNVKIMSKIYKLFESIKNYKNCFDFKKTKILFEHQNKNHNIDFIVDAKSLYKFFYYFLKIELNILNNYLLKILILNYVREFTSCASVLMFLVFIKTIIFDFVSIIKDWIFLLLKINIWFY